MRLAARQCAEIAERTRKCGAGQGWVCAKTHFFNTLARACAKVARKPRVACPCCGWEGFAFFWLDCGRLCVPWAQCPGCLAQERQRFLHAYLTRNQALLPKEDGRVLLFAPEPPVANLLKGLPSPPFCVASDYKRHEIIPTGFPGILSDMQQLPFRDGSFDFVFCLHVLEHVKDDRRGLSELVRILKPGGAAIIMVPFMMGQAETIEYPAPDPDMFDHVRGYSPLDFRERLVDFDYQEIYPPNVLSFEEIKRYQIPTDSQVIYYCRKKADKEPAKCW